MPVAVCALLIDLALSYRATCEKQVLDPPYNLPPYPFSQRPRGPKKHLKRLNAPSHWMLDKMGGAWVSFIICVLCFRCPYLKMPVLDLLR